MRSKPTQPTQPTHPQADGDAKPTDSSTPGPGNRGKKEARKPAGSYGELNYREEKSPRGRSKSAPTAR